MAVGRIGLVKGTLTRIGADMKIGLMGALGEWEGAPPEIRLFVKDDSERNLTLHPGETFLVGGQTWRLEAVEESELNELGAFFVRVE
ncbi:DUF6406 domain-containing protein [Actinomadura coerulea]|uniref:DUF6406 domain-containing protein n=1 Tax=Actinomadura coerulea TaxID=46159 RepID=UPI003413D062